jgi:triosephosphate isomerase (TIM)
MRKPFIAGNWKMNKNVADARHFTAQLMPGLLEYPTVDRVLCPPFTDLLTVGALLKGTDIGLGAQNMHWQDSGAFTGEISPEMVAEMCQYVIIGHSERRTLFGETDQTVNLKAKAALVHELLPIICVGETLEEYERGETGRVISRQIRAGLDQVSSSLPADKYGSLIIAYEPVWAIGTGKPSTPESAAAVIKDVIRAELAMIFGSDAAQMMRILYGGSVNGKNAAEFMSEAEIDGALVGGASLKITDFLQIVEAALTKK